MSPGANILDEFPRHMGRPPVYPWDEWTDGRVRELVRGVDFHSEPASFRVLAHRTARSRGLKAKTKIDGARIILVFYEGDE